MVTQALEAARGIDTDVVAGPLEGALVDVCVATETMQKESGLSMGTPVTSGHSA
jgi:hypothetical protein